MASVAECRKCDESYTVDVFRNLPLINVFTIDDGKEPSKIEIRTCCECGSAITLALTKKGTCHGEN